MRTIIYTLILLLTATRLWAAVAVLTVADVTPSVTTPGQTVNFSVNGSHLASGMNFSLTSCSNPSQLPGGTATRYRFSCTLDSSLGVKSGSITLGGQVVKGGIFSVTVVPMPQKQVPTLSSVTPNAVAPGKSVVFTATGSDLPAGLHFRLNGCIGVTEIPGGTTSRRFYSCITGPLLGNANGTLSNGTQLVSGGNFAVLVLSSSVRPTITLVTPNSAQAGQLTTFTVTGTNLVGGMQFTLADCSAAVELGGGSDTLRQFQCAPDLNPGLKSGLISDQSLIVNNGAFSVAVQGSPVKVLRAGDSHVMAILADNSLWGWGWNFYGQVGNGSMGNRSSPTEIGTGYADVQPALSNTYALSISGSLLAWGDNSRGEVGDGEVSSQPQLVPKAIANGFSLLMGPHYGLKTDATGWTWGGALVHGVVRSNFPIEYLQVSSGSATVAVQRDGSLWTWGANEVGQLGIGSTSTISQTSVPQQIGLGYVAVAAGLNFCMALKDDGTLWSWGYNPSGQLGDGTTTIRYSPVQIGSGFAAIAAGQNFGMGLKSDGSLWTWGFNSDGQLGNGTTTDQHSPVQIGTGFTLIAAGDEFAVAAKSDGTLWAWGNNLDGQLGDGTNINRSSPVQVVFPPR